MKTKILGIVVLALAFQVGIAQASTLLTANWDSSTTLDYAVGSKTPTTDSGTAIVSGGRFSNALDINSISDSLIYSGTSNFNQNQGTISFWFKNPYNDLTSADTRPFLEVATSGGAKLMTVWWSGTSMQSYVAAAGGGGIIGRTSRVMDTSLWHYVAVQWDAANGKLALWEGDTGEGTATTSQLYTGGAWTPSGAAATISIGTTGFGWTDLRAQYDNLVITDTPMYAFPTSVPSTIALPTAPLGDVPEPGTLVLLLTGLLGLICYAWQKRK